jgi:uncharacterized membrane protein
MKTIATLLKDERSSTREAIVARAPLLLAIFANIVVLVSDYRVYDYLYSQTGSWWKALIGILGCAVPFFLWEIGWQYNHTTDGWRITSLVMAGFAFATSITIGVADYVGMVGLAWGNWLLGFVVVEIGLHSVVALLYYYNDPDVARKRHRTQAQARMEDERLTAEESAAILRDGQSVLLALANLERQYNPADVEAVIRLLKGQSQVKEDDQASRNQNKNRSTTVPQTNFQTPPGVVGGNFDGAREKPAEKVFTNQPR